jgi:hypothetical protein
MEIKWVVLLGISILAWHQYFGGKKRTMENWRENSDPSG